MQENKFINEAFSIAIDKYLKNKDNPNNKEFDSFLVIVIRILILIYGELDIINPYRTNHETGLGGFDTNLKKYGLSDEQFEDFKNQVLFYYQNENNDEIMKSSFIKIQKLLIDMFILKKSHVLISDDEVQMFKSLLYFEADENLEKKNLYNRLTPNSNEILDYLNSKLFEQRHHFNLTEYKDVALSQEAYQIAGFNIVEVMNMSDKDIENVNNKVYHFFRIKDSDLNKRKRLESAIEYYKKYGNTLTSGNGYVDMLLLSGMIATGMMVITIIVINFMR